ncbi:ubiquitin carboxyl-terminal hydrolase 37-like isoform X2 [Epinephelus fuscoguttatus]|uniref:ubiquitin carboxyl-terminal hydrolase 37-like isoform X1 n=1 Tax=Epinephelus fuscoguttatus TaxID=293821 RepID=UPI0020D0EB09|nr:ubiquitin carboxyl-terminal hydrolase 37-like isoform X1 [Epinephelus fuscoguttatus]XP_049418183.1 ubiquitin carboxyl-terminal hydrolase 37-like isoform X2 [Epinephelus fuscoguttatus]
MLQQTVWIQQSNSADRHHNLTRISKEIHNTTKMLGQRIFGRKKKQQSHKKTVADEKRQQYSHQASGGVQDVPAAPVSAKPAEAWEDQQAKKKKWWNRLFGYLDKESVPGRRPSAPQERPTVTTSDAQTASQKEAVRNFWRWLLINNGRKHRVSPVNITSAEKTDSPNPERSSSPASTNNTDEQDECDEREAVTPFCSLDDVTQANSVDITDLEEKLFMARLNDNETNYIWDTDSSLDSPIDCFGFPNIGQTCYMNASLQSILTLEDFIGGISLMEHVWSSVPEAHLMRSLMDVRDVHSSIDTQVKIPFLQFFKDVVSAQAPDFWDTLQKDAHEFLTAVLEQMRGLVPLLQETAAVVGTHYTCPVEDHLVITMENTRTCKSCGAQSVRQEEFTNLSLDLLPGGSVEEMLQEYLKETEVEFRCDCGGNTSSCRSSFLTLPQVLILQLKRFRYSPFFELEKVDDPVRLTRDLLVSSTQDGGCYSLISAISHFGSTEMGHYISEGIHPDNNPDEPDDHWLTYNDSMVFDTSGKLVCEQQERGAYILFYKRIV